MTKDTVLAEDKTSAVTAGNDDNASGDANVEKIRDILFGVHMRDYEHRFKALEDRMSRDIAGLTEAMNVRLERMRESMSKQFDDLAGKLDSERAERGQEWQESQVELKKIQHRFEERLADVDAQHGATSDSIQSSLKKATLELTELIHENHTALTDSIRKESTALSDAKVAREELAAMLVQLARGLQSGTDGSS